MSKHEFFLASKGYHRVPLLAFNVALVLQLLISLAVLSLSLYGPSLQLFVVVLKSELHPQDQKLDLAMLLRARHLFKA